MQEEGPQLDRLTHRLAECPPEFQVEPRDGTYGMIDVAAIVCDHIRRMRPDGEIDDVVNTIQSISCFEKRRQQLIAITTCLLHDSWFLERPQFTDKMLGFLLAEKLTELSELVRPESMVSDPDRREELVRVCLYALGLRPFGESIAEAADRLTTLDSVERERVVRETRAVEARARQIREQMAKGAAQEAAARYSRE